VVIGYAGLIYNDFLIALQGLKHIIPTNACITS